MSDGVPAQPSDRGRAQAPGPGASGAELRTVLETLTDGVQIFDDAGCVTSRNAAAARMYEVDEAAPTVAAILERWQVIDEDGNDVAGEDRPLARAMRTGEGSDGRVVGIRRVLDGGVRWLSVSTAPVRQPGGTVSGYVSLSRDVTERIETIRGLRIITEAAGRLSSSLVPEEVVSTLTGCASELASLPGERPRRAVLMLVAGDNLVLRGLTDPTHSGAYPVPEVPLADNPYARQVLASGETLVTSFDPEDFGPSSADVIRSAAVRNAALVPMRRDGRIFAILSVSGRQDILLSAGIVAHLETLASIGGLAYVNAEKHEQASRESRTDPLTGAGNRRALEERWAVLPRCPFALIAVDVDHLKIVNDTHGHKAGDRLLLGVASAMAAQLRPSDLLVRTGGDEFVVLLVDCHRAGATRALARLQAAACAVSLPWGSASASFGFAVGAPGDQPEAVLAAADQALYRNKAKR